MAAILRVLSSFWEGICPCEMGGTASLSQPTPFCWGQVPPPAIWCEMPATAFLRAVLKLCWPILAAKNLQVPASILW